MTRARKITIGSAAALALLVAAGFAATAYLGRARPGHNVDRGGIALQGWDPVSYFPEGGAEPRQGDAGITAEHEGRRYRFVSTANRDRFVADPGRYEPQYGGWCAYAVANGYKFEVDPQSYLVEDGRLLLFYRGMLGDAREEFQNEGVAQGVAKADANWPALANEE
ncbi:MAG: YHS domain-containing (seleno)protein [Thermodesulfobacteriota bacterium]